MAMHLLEGLFGVAPPLDQYDEQEAEDLALHVRQCTRRYAALSRQQTLTIRLVMLVVALLILNGSLSMTQTVDRIFGNTPTVVSTAQAGTTHN